MHKILAVLIIAGVLVLALSVPALAGPSVPPSAFGQYVALLANPAGITSPGAWGYSVFLSATGGPKPDFSFGQWYVPNYKESVSEP